MNYEGTMNKINTEQLTITDVKHFPVVKHYAKRLRLVETINEMVPSGMNRGRRIGDRQKLKLDTTHPHPI
jgi:hypothetical protein